MGQYILIQDTSVWFWGGDGSYPCHNNDLSLEKEPIKKPNFDDLILFGRGRLVNMEIDVSFGTYNFMKTEYKKIINLKFELLILWSNVNFNTKLDAKNSCVAALLNPNQSQKL